MEIKIEQLGGERSIYFRKYHYTFVINRYRLGDMRLYTDDKLIGVFYG